MTLVTAHKVIAPGDRIIPWLSECSNQWHFKPLKYFCSTNRLSLPETTDPEYEFLYIDINSVSAEGHWTPSECIVFRDAPSRARRIIQDGDVIISTVRTYLKAISFIEKIDGNLICSTGFAVLTPSAKVYPKFLFYWARSGWFINEIVARSVGVSYPAINAIEIGNLPFPLIDLEEQRAITAFLDRETARIDELMARKQRLIELLFEQRTALITHAVTKGLDPDTAMKDSRLEWLGEIPAHWEVKAIWMLFYLGRGRVISNEEILDNPGSYPVYSSQTETEGVFGYLNSYDFQGEYITWTTDGANAGTAFYRRGQFNCTNVCGTLSSKWQGTDLRFFTYAINRLTPWFVRPDINPKLMNNVMAGIRIQLPPDDEQRVIGDYLDQETSRIDTLVGRINRAIEKLQEYRSALITAAVMGKIDVRQRVS